jgi:uncharacterized protein (DUF488 family)
MSKTLYTIGHSRRSIGELLEMLTYAGIAQLVDVRAYPHSTRHPWFNDAALRPALEQTGVAYRWLGHELGGLREQRPNSPHVALPAGGLRAFADYMETPQFTHGAELLIDAAARARTAIMCAEASPTECHRGLLADYLLTCDVAVVHLIKIGEIRAHTLHPAARKDSGRLVYDRVAQRDLVLE